MLDPLHPAAPFPLDLTILVKRLTGLVKRADSGSREADGPCAERLRARHRCACFGSFEASFEAAFHTMAASFEAAFHSFNEGLVT